MKKNQFLQILVLASVAHMSQVCPSDAARGDDSDGETVTVQRGRGGLGRGRGRGGLATVASAAATMRGQHGNESDDDGGSQDEQERYARRSNNVRSGHNVKFAGRDRRSAVFGGDDQDEQEPKYSAAATTLPNHTHPTSTTTPQSRPAAWWRVDKWNFADARDYALMAVGGTFVANRHGWTAGVDGANRWVENRFARPDGSTPDLFSGADGNGGMGAWIRRLTPWVAPIVGVWVTKTAHQRILDRHTQQVAMENFDEQAANDWAARNHIMTADATTAAIQHATANFVQDGEGDQALVRAGALNQAVRDMATQQWVADQHFVQNGEDDQAVVRAEALNQVVRGMATQEWANQRFVRDGADEQEIVRTGALRDATRNLAAQAWVTERFAAVDHNHDQQYAAIDHQHDN